MPPYYMPGLRWSDTELDILKHNYRNLSAKAMSRTVLPSRDHRAISRMAARLGLRKIGALDKRRGWLRAMAYQEKGPHPG